MPRKLDVLLVTPPSREAVFQDLGQNLIAIEPPVWSTLIAKYLRQKSISVEIFDAEAESLSFDATARRVIDTQALLTVFVIYGHQPSASTQCMPSGRAVCKRICLEAPLLKTMVMGTHASALPERTLKEEPYKFVCSGEGPKTIQGLVEVLKSNQKEYKKVPGLWYWDDEKVCSTKNSENISNLDKEIPSQAWDLLNMNQYRAHNWHCFDHINQRQPYASLQTSLGCPYKCSFCCINAPFGGEGIRYWTPKLVVDQIDLLVNEYGVKNIKIPDEMFVLSEQHLMGICDLIIERGYNLNIWAYARVDTVKDRYLEKLKRAGFNWLALGIESSSQFVRDGVDKGRFGDLDIIKTTNKIKEHGIYIIANYIFGLPDDTIERMQDTLRLALTINAEWANFYCAMAYPGSPLYDRAKKLNLPLPDDSNGPGWGGYSQHSYDSMPLPTDTLSGQDVLDFRDSAFNEYFSNPSFLDITKKKFGQPVIDHIQSMLAVELKRKHRDIVKAN